MDEMTNEQYENYVKEVSPNSPLWKDMVKAFVSGGAICCVGQVFLNCWKLWGLAAEDAATATSITLVLLGAVLTGLGIYDRMARFSGAGTLVPITGFANSVVAPALEFKSEGFVTGTAAKMFVIAGPVIVFGISASVVYGLILCLLGMG